MTAPGTGTVRITVTTPTPPDGTARTGLQDTAGELAPGHPVPGATTRYELDVPVRPSRAKGVDALDFAGPHVHGTPGGRFLYLSRRAPDGPGWERRCKIMLPEAAPAAGSRLSAVVADASASRARLTAAGWTTEAGPATEDLAG
ncbi:DUF5990 family protein [Streptomyces stramineus]|uniref:Uncharacterized protein n=1 Tax=Streptomyces stramineus TaxID=173861 RepID=A0ABN1BAH3_9ACTN